MSSPRDITAEARQACIQIFGQDFNKIEERCPDCDWPALLELTKNSEAVMVSLVLKALGLMKG